MRDEKGRFVKGSKIGEEYRFKKGVSSWSKGLKRPGFGFQPGHEVSEEVRQKLREANLGENSPSFGIKRSDETKEKIRITKLRDKNPHWNGGRKTMRGYVYILKPEHPFNNNGYVLEHRLVMEEALNRYLKPEEVVHHINEIRDDNRLENLMLFENDGKHKAYHHQLRRLAMTVT
ncbi:MAG: NUMOD3 domain-containing DNA-binding protein [Candidatus Paceibacterota bacterium]|jgi:hypothetical protein